MKGKLLLLLLLLLCFNSFCQVKPSIFYFDKDLNISVKSKSVYTGEGKWDDGLFLMDLYDNKNHYHIFSAHYTDTTLAVMDGRFISYYNNGNVENLSYYSKGKPEGLWIKWDADKKVMDSVWYRNGEPDSSVTYYYDYRSRKLTSTVRNNFTDSSTIRTRYDEHEQALAQDLSDSIKVGEDKVVEKPDEEVAFPGSDSAMNSYFQYRFDRRRFNLVLQGTSGSCILKFKVDKNGQVLNIESPYCDNNILKNAMSDAVRDIAWLPATKDGKPVTAIKEVSETYTPSIAGLTNDNQRRYFFDVNFNAASQDDAPYFGKLNSEDNLIKLTVHYNQHTNKIFSMHFTDSTLQIASGEFESFYLDNQKKVRGNFLLGQKDGWWLEWNDDGQVIDSSLYVNRTKTYEVSTVYQPEGAPGTRIIWDYINNKKREIYYDRRIITSDVTVPIYGTEQAGSKNVFNIPEVAPSFPGGVEAWDEYVRAYLHKNLPGNHRDGICMVRFIVDTDGKVYGAEALTLKGSSLATTMMGAVMSSPEWTPATQDGKKVKAYVILPMQYYFVPFSTPTQNKRYIHPLIINSVRLVSPTYQPN